MDAKLMRTYLRYIAPSTLAFMLAGIYSVVDGLFVGHVIGDNGLASINLAYPLLAAVLSTGTGLGLGGAIISSIRLGEENVEGSRQATAHTITLLALASPVIMLLLVPSCDSLLFFMGARGEVLDYSARYMGVIILGIPFQVLATGCIPLIRNRGHVMYAMMASMLGGTLNTIGDFVLVFILHWGVEGAALATVLSQAADFTCCALFFLRKDQRMPLRMFKPSWCLAKRSISNGFAPFVLTLAPEVTTVTLNIAVGACGGSTAQAALAVISYTGVSIQWMIQGVNDGSQPLISRYFGAGDLKTVKALRHTNFAFAIGIGCLGAILLCGLKGQFSLIFGISPEATALFFRGITLFALGLPLYGLAHAITSNFYAMESGKSASTIIAVETASIVGLGFFLSVTIGLDGAWATPSATQVILCALALFLLYRKKPELERRAIDQARKRERNVGGSNMEAGREGK